jgi:GrpB-like predicted nucleotidyltransferase (UPF0157 family)
MQEPVVIVEYDPRWPVMFEEEKALLQKTIGGKVQVFEHMGSTAVPGLGAKPIIDIIAAVRRLEEAEACVEPLQALNYVYVPEFNTVIPERRFFRKVPRTHHLHFTTAETEFWKRQLLFRDYLRLHPETAQEYFRLKVELAAKFGSDRDGYTNAKTEFIKSIEERARAFFQQ